MNVLLYLSLHKERDCEEENGEGIQLYREVIFTEVYSVALVFISLASVYSMNMKML